jgi:hypothetical protein
MNNYITFLQEERRKDMRKQKSVLLLVVITGFAITLFLPGLVRADIIMNNT